MEEDTRTIKEIIERIVRQEITNILADTKDVIREAVKSILLPELRAAIRDSISEIMEEMVDEQEALSTEKTKSASISKAEAEITPEVGEPPQKVVLVEDIFTVWLRVVKG